MKTKLVSVMLTLMLVLLSSLTALALASENQPIEISVQDVWADSLQWGKGG